MPDDDAPGSLHQATPGGVIADHSPPGLLPVNIAPTTTSDQNVVVAALIPLACFRIEDIRFAFDSSAVLPGIAAEIPLLAKLRDRHTLRAPDRPDAPPPISLFGHADPVGQDDYNKSLAGRRATAIYALLTRTPALWEKLFSHPIAGSGDRWGGDTLDVMANTVDPAQAAQRSQAARTSVGARSALFLDYMNKIAGSFRLAKEDFLGRGADPDGKADYQGCGEFNPVLLFSREDEREFQKPQNRDDRNDRNAPNRRVMALLFRPLTRVNIDKWPCPRATEGKAKCLTRFWSDADVRRNTHLPGQERRFEDTHDTFACRFYHRLTTLSPCERVLPRLNATVEIILDNDDNHAVDANEPAAQFVRVGLWDHAFDPATAAVRDNPAEDQNFIGLDSRGPEARRFYFRVNDPNAVGQPQVSLNWRTEFGAGGNDDAPASQVITLLPTAADPAVFVSHSVFLVSDGVDQVQPTNSGLPAGNPDTGSRGLTQSNHRIRRITVDDTHRLDTNVVADYNSLLGGQTSRVTVPLFRRSPDERLKIRVHLINVRTAVGGPPVVIPARIDAAKSTLRSVYACTGIFLEIDEVQVDPPASCTGWLARFPGDPLAIGADPAVELPPIVNNLLRSEHVTTRPHQPRASPVEFRQQRFVSRLCEPNLRHSLADATGEVNHRPGRHLVPRQLHRSRFAGAGFLFHRRAYRATPHRPARDDAHHHESPEQQRWPLFAQSAGNTSCRGN